MIAVPAAPLLYLAAETTDNRLLLASRGNVLVVDLRRGVLERRVSGVNVLIASWTDDPRVRRYEGGTPLLGADSRGKVKIWSAGS
jgi:hypothetical protein